jgi:5-methyltetrahydropteroyltriglutamate--homocysteine methyltransferase
MYAVEEGAPRDVAFRSAVDLAVADVVAKQHEAGIDVMDDGEVGKPGFIHYVSSRLEGLGGQSEPWILKDLEELPELFASQYETEAIGHVHVPRVIGPLQYVGLDELSVQLASFRAALAAEGAPNGFVTAPAPGAVSHIMNNDSYSTYEEYVMACADAMRSEYEAIAAEGFILQLDAPDLPTMWPEQVRFASSGIVDQIGYDRFLDLHIEAIKSATAGIAPEQLRLHLCWGNYIGPHDRDVPLRRVIEPVLRRARPSAISFESANPRHEHEWQVFKDLKVPEDKVLIPGVIDSLTNFVEHPELVAQRIERFASVVDRDQIIAGTDCGFGTFVGFGAVYPLVVWKKLRSLAEGAQIASSRLWP